MLYHRNASFCLPTLFPQPMNMARLSAPPDIELISVGPADSQMCFFGGFFREPALSLCGSPLEEPPPRVLITSPHHRRSSSCLSDDTNRRLFVLSCSRVCLDWSRAERAARAARAPPLVPLQLGPFALFQGIAGE